MTSKHATRLLYVALGIFLACSLTFYVMQTTALLDRAFGAGDRIQLPFLVDEDVLTVDHLAEGARTAGLREGDRLLELRGEPYHNREQLMGLRAGTKRLHPGDAFAVTVQHANGALLHTSLRAAKVGSAGRVSTLVVVLSIVFPLVCLLIGYWVAAARIHDPHAWLLLALFTVPSGLSDPYWWPGGAFYYQLAWYGLLQFIAAPTLLLFGIYFPERWRVDQRRPWAKWLLLGPVLVSGVLTAVTLWIELAAAPRLGHLSAALGHILTRFLAPFYLLCVIFYGVALVDKLRSATTADARRRMQVLTAGSVVGIGSLMIIFVLLPFFGLQPQTHPWVVASGFFLFFAAPFSFAYVVVVQRALDVRILLRMGTKYAVARATIVMLEVALVAFVFFHFLLPLFVHHENLPLAVGATIVAAALGIKLFAARDSISHRIQRSLDRRFFREAYDAELVLSELSEQARRFTEAGPLVDLVSRRIAEVLHISRVAVYLRHGRSYGMERCIGLQGDVVPKRFEESSSTVRNLARSNQPATLYRENPDGWFLLTDDRERRALDVLGTELLLPLTGRDRLLGFLSLGSKRSEEPYTPSDLRLLHSVGAQAGLALEISTLVHSLASEAARRERIDREIEIAREVQERLFPQQMPTLPGISLHGACRPAQGVGGDYYDILALDGDRLGLAIGDVSGKGISAALLMASLRASLRGMTMQNPDDLALLMSRVNRLVYESSASNRYATFFFGIYDPATRLLRYVNAGHNPPYVLRRSDLHSLEGGGPVIGLLPDAPYEECEITLEPGDLLLAYTDGISEALNTQEQEWGEERMVAAARERLPEDASVILRHIVSEADRFAAAAPQHDDMTLLLMKLQTATL